MVRGEIAGTVLAYVCGPVWKAKAYGIEEKAKSNPPNPPGKKWRKGRINTGYKEPYGTGQCTESLWSPTQEKVE